MQYMSNVPRSILIVTLFSGIVYGEVNYEKPTPMKQTLVVIRDCMSASPAPWPDEWKIEYIETIRKAIESYQNAPQYNLKLETLCKGFESYWGSFKKTQERSLFEVHSTRIRWYTEHLMGTKFPTDQERQKLRYQYTDIWYHAASSLLAQFPFLDPNAVESAKSDDLNVCYSKIEAPLSRHQIQSFATPTITLIPFLLDMFVVLLISQKDYEPCGNPKDWEVVFGIIGIWNSLHIGELVFGRVSILWH